MKSQKIISSIIILFLLGSLIFSFFYFSYDEIIKENVRKMIPLPFLDNLKTSQIKNNDGGVISLSSSSGTLTIKGIIEETNKHRATYNISPLQEDFGLNAIAQMKLDKMFNEQYFAHISPGGVGVSDIADSVGYGYLTIGDNLARGDYKDDVDVVDAWMDSLGHRRNILEEKYERIGIAARKDYYKDREEWIAVQVFAMPTSACPETDKNLLNQIENKKKEVERIEERRKQIQYEIDNIQRGSEEHMQKVEEYNNTIILYNATIKEVDEMISDYNNQIRIREECIKK